MIKAARRVVRSAILGDLQRQEFRIAEQARFQHGIVHSRLLEGKDFPDPAQAAFRAYSQFGEDGILQYLLARILGCPRTFVEIGVEDYRESNTRFLAEKDGWSGLLIDQSPEAQAFLGESFLAIWRDIRFKQAFVSRENLTELLAFADSDLGLLSIDVDGMDYYLWEAATSVSPRIVVVEYNPTFGWDLPLAVPYDPKFSCAAYHPSELCFGASLAAFAHLAEKKGYALVCASDGPNAFFVRNDCLGSLKPRTPKDSWRDLRVRSGKDVQGGYLSASTAEEKRKAIADCRLVNVISGETRTVAEWFDEDTSTRE